MTYLTKIINVVAIVLGEAVPAKPLKVSRGGWEVVGWRGDRTKVIFVANPIVLGPAVPSKPLKVGWVAVGWRLDGGWEAVVRCLNAAMC